MGIYDSGLDLNLDFARGKLIPIIGIVVALIIIVVLAYWVVSNYETSPLSFDFEKNPINTTESTTVTISVSNQSDSDAENVSLSLETKEKSEFDIYSSNEKFDGTISLLSTGTSRKVSFVVNPIGEILSGTYTLVAKATINGAMYEKEEKLFVE